MHEPRYKQGLGLGYALSPTGADHCHNIHDSAYVAQSPALEEIKAFGILEPLPLADLSAAKVRMLAYLIFWRNVINSLVLCYFMHFSPPQVVEVVKGVTGWNTSLWELMKVGERCVAMNRAFNVREGLGKGDDYLPQRFFTPFTSGPFQGVAINRESLEQAKEIYYNMMGWEGPEGAPSKGKLQELGVGWVADLSA